MQHKLRLKKERKISYMSCAAAAAAGAAVCGCVRVWVYRKRSKCQFLAGDPPLHLFLQLFPFRPSVDIFFEFLFYTP